LRWETGEDDLPRYALYLERQIVVRGIFVLFPDVLDIYLPRSD
tara:strand:+ start:813 stop:941 length:129 start_codon:yes stop_codon:yes gene_type:complete